MQARAGCACAGPYAQHLLGISYDLAKQLEDGISQHEGLHTLTDKARKGSGGKEMLRPGFCRISFHYSATLEFITYVTDAGAIQCHVFLPLFYSCSHAGLMSRFVQYSQQIPVFITEWGYPTRTPPTMTPHPFTPIDLTLTLSANGGKGWLEALASLHLQP